MSQLFEEIEAIVKRYSQMQDYLEATFSNLGEASTSCLAGWSNLTQAIQDGENIDWEKLDGLPAKCINPELGALTYKLELDSEYNLASAYAHTSAKYMTAWNEAVVASWHGDDGWVIWIEGDIPLKTKTAEQLKPGTCFVGKHPKNAEMIYAIIVQHRGGKLSIFTRNGCSYPPEEVKVLKEYNIGTFDENA